MMSQFYLIGDDLSTAQTVAAEPKYKFDDLKKAAGQALHVAVPAGITFHSSEDKDLLSIEDVLAATGPIGLRIDGQAVQNPQGPAGLPLVGSCYEIFPDHPGNHHRLFRKYGHAIKTTNMSKTTYLTDSPDTALAALLESQYFTKKIGEAHPLWVVKDNTAIFVCDTENDNWRLAHKFLPPAMGPKAVRHYTPLMQSCVHKSFKIFDQLDERGESWNVYQFMVKLASETIGKFALGVDFGPLR